MSLAIRPFLKWPGGKFRLLSLLKQYFPPAEYFVEPFVGAGSVFLNVEYPAYIVGDVNADLIGIYRMLGQKPAVFIKEARTFFQKRMNRKEVYYRLRDRFNQSTEDYERACLFLYLNRHGYNGLCRYNQSGGYNVPFGEIRKPYFPEAELQHYAARAARVSLFQEDFKDVMLAAPKSSVVYCDPPYLPLESRLSFTAYAGNCFAWEEHEALAACARKLARRNIRVVVSNHDVPVARELYRGATLLSVSVPRMMSCDITARNKVKELIAIF